MSGARDARRNAAGAVALAGTVPSVAQSPGLRATRPAVDPTLERQLAFLRAHGAADTAHSRGTLLEHLSGTRMLLARWGNDADTCAAGLFHSVYGTYVFSHAIVGQEARGSVRAVIGEHAERLAWIFCTVDRRSFFARDPAGGATLAGADGSDTSTVDRATLARLVEIEAADTVEQLPRRKPRRQREYEWYREAFESNLDLLSAGAVAGFREAFERARESWAESV